MELPAAAPDHRVHDDTGQFRRARPTVKERVTCLRVTSPDGYRSTHETNLRNVVTGVRKRIERDQANPVLLRTERNIGYRLVIRVDPAATA
jgi:DNA-binding response OmpR family regulator